MMSYKKDLIQWCKLLDDETLLSETYKALYDSLGSCTDLMYELGYDISDILEQESYERFLCIKFDILQNECAQRGLKLFE